MRKFIATSESVKLPDLLKLCQRFCDEQWVADHLADDLAAACVFDQFRRTIERELQLLEIRCASQKRDL